MKLRLFFSSFAVFIFFLQASIPNAAMAEDLIVEQNAASGSGHYSTVQEALTHASNIIVSQPTSTFRVVIRPGTYTGSFTLISNVPILGVETARTFLIGGGAGTLITASNVTGLSIKNVTIKNAARGISVANSTVDITNNVFQVGTNGIAIDLQNAPQASIINNTFYQNGTAINTSSNIPIINNIFSTNVTAISSQVSLTQIKYNDYYNNSTIGLTQAQIDTSQSIPSTYTTQSANPLFVNPAGQDFHLLEGSPCHGRGSTDYPNAVDSATYDIGAYGGLGADTIPYIVSGTKANLFTADSATVSWSPNNSYVVTNTDPASDGGYNVYYSLGKSGSPYDNKITLSSAMTSTVISGLTTTVPIPDAPVLSEPGFISEALLLSWSVVPTATSYVVHYTDLVTSVTNTISVGNTTTYTLTGLVNGRSYTITVSAISQPVYHFSVTAFDYSVVAAGGGTPGEEHESAYLSPDVSLVVGSPSESLLSNAQTEYPEPIVPYPNLPNKGCFIATAAYGYYSAPQVLALRAFRDRFLETNSPGRSFVRWYYRYGPIGAEYMNRHSWLKPVVRIALLPAVGGALFMTKTSLPMKVAALLLIGILSFYIWMRKRLGIHSGGSR